jgi:hypothetical protein
LLQFHLNQIHLRSGFARNLYLHLVRSIAVGRYEFAEWIISEPSLFVKFGIWPAKVLRP